MKKLKIKHLAQLYNVSVKVIEDELAEQGIEPQGDCIPDDMVELVESYFKDLYDEERPKAAKKKPAKKPEGKVITLPSPVIVKSLAEALGKKPNELISELIKLGELAGINQPVSEANAKKLCKLFGRELVIGGAAENTDSKSDGHVPTASSEEDQDDDDSDNAADLVTRPPVVTFMGHVDHGKTSLQDAVRHTHVVDGEAGAITQHIGASTVMFKNQQITFIDTPGHAAFSSMRARGANCTDLVILVVSAAEGFKPQTIEAMNHALAAKVPIIVAINKMDLPEANPDKVLMEMQQNNLFSEDWGGNVGTVRVSARTGAGLEDLLDRILLEAEILELKANPKRKAKGVILEAQVEPGLGPTAHVLVQNGTLKNGDAVLCGKFYGKVRLMISDKGAKLKSAGPSTPVKLVGLSGVPEAGDKLEVCASEKEARQRAEERIAAARAHQQSSSSIATAEDLFSTLQKQEKKSLAVVIKADVKGSGEAIAQSLQELPSEKIKVDVISNSVGAITENDVLLASASNALIVGFHVRVNPGVNDLAKREGVEIRLYSIIYELLEDISDALAGKLEPEKREKVIGNASILQIFELSKGPKICGCRVDNGVVRVGAKARVFRKKDVIYNGSVASLRHFQNDVKEMKAGMECGIKLDNFNDFEVGDTIEIYEIELKKATL